MNFVYCYVTFTLRAQTYTYDKMRYKTRKFQMLLTCYATMSKSESLKSPPKFFFFFSWRSHSALEMEKNSITFDTLTWSQKKMSLHDFVLSPSFEFFYLCNYGVMKHYIGPKLYFLRILDHSDVLYTISRYHVLSLPSAIDKKETGKRGRRTKSCSDNLFCRLLTHQVTVLTALHTPQ